MSVNVNVISRKAAVTLSARWLALQYTAAGKVGLPTADGEAIVGVGLDTASADEEVGVGIGIVAKGIAGAALTAAKDGQKLMAKANGRLIPYVAAAGNYHIANWLPSDVATSAADGDLIDVQWLGAVADR